MVSVDDRVPDVFRFVLGYEEVLEDIQLGIAWTFGIIFMHFLKNLFVCDEKYLFTILNKIFNCVPLNT